MHKCRYDANVIRLVVFFHLRGVQLNFVYYTGAKFGAFLQDTDPNLSHLHTACQSEPSDEGVLHDSLLADNLIMVVPSRLKWTSPGGNFALSKFANIFA